VLSVATAEVILGSGDYAEAYRRYYLTFPDAGYGGTFHRWGSGELGGPYGSYGNGSAMRVSPIGWAFDSVAETLAEAYRSAAVTHDHPEGTKGAQAVALAIFLARTGQNVASVRDELEARFAYDLSRSPDDIRPDYSFDVTCQGSVPEALSCAFHAESVEEAIRLAISLGGDADTQACIAGGVAEAFYGPLNESLRREVIARLPMEFARILQSFGARYMGG
jgi:ADP-ribosylglycohydrolase